MPEVLTHIGGSYCVVFLTPQIYIDARSSVQHPELERIEVVIGGRVREVHMTTHAEAPSAVVEIMRRLKRYVL